MSNITAKSTTGQAQQPDNYKIGLAFETYIRKLFNERSFDLQKWRKSEKISGSDSFLDLANPDLEMIFVGQKKYRFAVECKWRATFKEGKITWATDEQITTYLRFQHQKLIPVFIAIGIGGISSKPEKLFVTPLINICGNKEVYECDLIPFKRKPTHRFFYDTVQLKLF